MVPYATCVFHSPELCLDLLARWGMSQINLVGAVMCDSVRTLCAEWHLSPPNTATLSKVFLISQEINERKMDFFFFFLPVLANGNTSVVLGYIGRALHEIFWVCGQFDLNFGSKTISAELGRYVKTATTGQSPSSCRTEAQPRKIREDGELGHIVPRHAPWLYQHPRDAR